MENLSTKNSRILQTIVWIMFAIMAYLICTKVQYTDGDDAFFYEMANSKGFFEYIVFRYITWEGRATSEGMTWIAFRLGIDVWRFINALMLTLLPASIVHIVKKMLPNRDDISELFICVVSCVAILFMDMEVIGYSSIWMTGSTFYLWSVVCGMWAIMPFVDLYTIGQYNKKSLIYSIPLGFIAAMGLEQIAAVDIAFGAIILLVHYIREKKVDILLLLQWIITTIGLIVLFISPGTSARSADEIATWMPEFATMSLGQHIFITLQFLCNSLAVKSRMYMIMLWFAIAIINNKKGIRRFAEIIISFVLIVTTALSYIGITLFSEVGIGVEDITKCVDKVASWTSITLNNRFAIIWWCLVIVVTLVLLWDHSDRLADKLIAELFFLAGLACTLIMYFTPTIYASGGRVLFMMDVMFWLLVIWLLRKIKDTKKCMIITSIMLVGGMLQFVSGLSYMRSFF